MGASCTMLQTSWTIPVILLDVVLLMSLKICYAETPTAQSGRPLCGGSTASDNCASVKYDTELELLLASLPDKTDDVMTVTHRFRKDLLEFCTLRDCAHKVAVEIGCYRGHTTALLSHAFRQVFALDHSGVNLAAARQLNANRSNVVYLRFEMYGATQHFGWASLLSENDIQVAFVDASHLYEHVVSDIHNALELPRLETLVFDDYGLIEPVREAVNSYIEAGMLECTAIGEDMEPLLQVKSIEDASKWWTGRAKEPGAAKVGAAATREGLICDVLQRGPQPSWHRAVIGLHFGCYQIAIVGKAVPYLDFTFKVGEEHWDFFWPDSAREMERIASSHQVETRVELQVASSSLAPDFFFGSKLRNGFFLRDGEPEHFCVVSEDMNWMHSWTREDVANAFRSLEG